MHGGADPHLALRCAATHVWGPLAMMERRSMASAAAASSGAVAVQSAVVVEPVAQACLQNVLTRGQSLAVGQVAAAKREQARWRSA